MDIQYHFEVVTNIDDNTKFNGHNKMSWIMEVKCSRGSCTWYKHKGSIIILEYM
jgi:hypothetical protein